jgi:hypothetical protein
MPNFGNTTIGTNRDFAALANAVVLRRCTLPEFGALTHVVAYMDTGVCSGIGVCYANDGAGGTPGTLLAQSAETLLTPGILWDGLELSRSLVAADYWLGILFSTNQSRVYSIKEAGSSGYAGDTYADGPENPLGGFVATPLYNPCIYGIYVVEQSRLVKPTPPNGPHQYQRRAATPPTKRFRTV